MNDQSFALHSMIGPIFLEFTAENPFSLFVQMPGLETGDWPGKCLASIVYSLSLKVQAKTLFKMAHLGGPSGYVWRHWFCVEHVSF